jgi:hypothetical protein
MDHPSFPDYLPLLCQNDSFSVKPICEHYPNDKNKGSTRKKKSRAGLCLRKPMEASGRGLLKRQNHVLPLFGILFIMSMMFIMDMLMGVHRRRVGVFGAAVAMGYFLMSVLMFMRIFFTHD